MSEGPAARPEIDVFQWLTGTEPTWTSWTVAVLVGVGAAIYGGRGILAKFRNEPPDRFTPRPAAAVGYLAFGFWVLWVFATSRWPQ